MSLELTAFINHLFKPSIIDLNRTTAKSLLGYKVLHEVTGSNIAYEELLTFHRYKELHINELVEEVVLEFNRLFGSSNLAVLKEYLAVVSRFLTSDKIMSQKKIDEFINAGEHYWVLSQNNSPLLAFSIISFRIICLEQILASLNRTLAKLVTPKVKNLKKLKLLGLPETTKELNELVVKADKEKELGELFSWRLADEISFENWLNNWFYSYTAFKSLLLGYLKELDPEFKPAIKEEKEIKFYKPAKIKGKAIKDLAINYVANPDPQIDWDLYQDAAPEEHEHQQGAPAPQVPLNAF